jgi:hypothetical protein
MKKVAKIKRQRRSSGEVHRKRDTWRLVNKKMCLITENFRELLYIYYEILLCSLVKDDLYMVTDRCQDGWFRHGILPFFANIPSVFRNHDILVWIRIREVFLLITF